MNIINYFDSSGKSHWLDEIKRCDWGAGAYLCELLENGRFFEMTGMSSKLLLLTEGDELLAFCTLSEKDDIRPTELSPWVGFVYTYPEHRGKRLFGLLLDKALKLAKQQGFDKLYISTDHVGLYEKYGCEFLTEMTDVRGDMSRVYFKEVMK